MPSLSLPFESLVCLCKTHACKREPYTAFVRAHTHTHVHVCVHTADACACMHVPGVQQNSKKARDSTGNIQSDPVRDLAVLFCRQAIIAAGGSEAVLPGASRL